MAREKTKTIVEALPEVRAPLLRRREIAVDTVELTFDCSDRPLDFSAGEYLSLIAPPEIGVTSPSDQRDLSIASSPENPEAISIAYRESDSPVKRWLRDVAPGTAVTLRGPTGSFRLPDDGSPIAMVAGGIGVTPFRSMLLDPASAERRTGLFCWNASPERTPYADELAALTDDGLRELVTEIGLPQPQPLQGWLDRHSDSHWLVSGPSEMVWNVLATLEKMGVSKDRIRTEEFTGYEDRPDG